MGLSFDLWGLTVQFAITERAAIVAMICLNFAALWLYWLGRERGRG
ncbi:MAG: hypothetical protein M0R06_22000 [Sphaerochaeta sp.]|jgi:hypothetical protein|nr:hypothetical protein [Sphaerochaeta sp.]